MTASAHAAGPPPQPNAAQIQLALAKLGVAGSVLYVAAHPDDENTALLAYLANGALVRAGYLSLTRGDGGQNLVGAEQGPELGLIRTQELLAARRIDGAEQFFTRARDFGYSKSPDETLRIWGKDAVLADVVWVIRRFRPDVIITRFSPEPSDTHGHHTASAMLALEAFHAAADPRFHPEQLADGVTTWQARRLLWNRSLEHEAERGSVGLREARRRRLQPAARRVVRRDRGRQPQHAQEPGLRRGAQPRAERRILQDPRRGRRAGGRRREEAAERAPGNRRSRGSTSRSVAGARPRACARRSSARRQFDPAHPAATIPALLEVDAALDGVPDAGWRARKQREVHDLIAACAGLFVDATAADFSVAPGESIEVIATLVNRLSAPFTLARSAFPAPATPVTVGRDLRGDASAVAAPVEVKHTVKVPADAPLTTPYWLASPPQPGGFAIADQQLVGLPEDPPQFPVDFVLDDRWPHGGAVAPDRVQVDRSGRGRALSARGDHAARVGPSRHPGPDVPRRSTSRARSPCG